MLTVWRTLQAQTRLSRSPVVRVPEKVLQTRARTRGVRQSTSPSRSPVLPDLGHEDRSTLRLRSKRQRLQEAEVLAIHAYHPRPVPRVETCPLERRQFIEGHRRVQL